MNTKVATPASKVAPRVVVQKKRPVVAQKAPEPVQTPTPVVDVEELDDITRELLAVEKTAPEPSPEKLAEQAAELLAAESASLADDTEDDLDSVVDGDEVEEEEEDGTDEPDDDGHNYEDDATDGILTRVSFTPASPVEDSIIPTQQIVDDNGRDVIMLWKPERCLSCSYLVGDLVINGEETVANDKCHHEFATKGGVRVGNPNCPAKTLRFVKGVNFDKLSSGLAQAMRDKDVAGLHAIYGELATLDPAVSKRVVSLAEESL